MDKPSILHILSPLAHVSPFDITMACDAGFDAVMPYPNVTLQEISGLVQDVIFPRSPKDLKRSAILIGVGFSLAFSPRSSAPEPVLEIRE